MLCGNALMVCHEMATGGRSRVAQISHELFCKIVSGPNSLGGLNIRGFTIPLFDAGVGLVLARTHLSLCAREGSPGKSGLIIL